MKAKIRAWFVRNAWAHKILFVTVGIDYSWHSEESARVGRS